MNPQPTLSKLSTYSIGRGADCDVCLTHTSISRVHAELVVTADGRFYLTDCGSTNGTFVARVGRWERLQQAFIVANDTVRFGKYEMTTAQLQTLCAAGGAAVAVSASGAAAPVARAVPKTVDSRKILRRDPETGEIITHD